MRLAQLKGKATFKATCLDLVAVAAFPYFQNILVNEFAMRPL